MAAATYLLTIGGIEAWIAPVLKVGSVSLPVNTTPGDLTALRAMFGTDTSLTSGPIVFIKQPTMNNEVFRMESVGSGTIGNARISRYQGGVETTDATVTTLVSVVIPTDTTVQIDAWAQGRRTGGTGGATGDSGGYEDRGVFKNIAGVVTQVGTTDHSMDKEDQATWNSDFAISGTSVLYQVNGAVNNNVRWHGNMEVMGWVS